MSKPLLFFLAVAVFGAGGFAILHASHPAVPAPPQAPKIESPAAPQVSQREFQEALERISKLERENEELEKSARENYPSEIEKAALDLSTVGTYIAIALTLAAVIVALVSFNRFQDSLRSDARAEAFKVVNSLADYLQGRFSLTIGYVLGQVAWNKHRAYKPSPLTYVSEEAVRYLTMAHKLLGKASEPEFEKLMDRQRWFALNNLIFYITLAPSHENKSLVPGYAKELKTAPNFRKSGSWINTYCRAAILFSEDFSNAYKISTKDVLDEVDALLKLQKNNSLTERNRGELALVLEQAKVARGKLGKA